MKNKKKIYVTPPNPLCDLCDHLLFGMVRIADMVFYACREEKCRWAEKEMETDFETAEGEQVIVRKLLKKKTERRKR